MRVFLESKCLLTLLLSIFLTCWVQIVNVEALVVSEIQAKPPTPQAGKEWIEVFNDTGERLDLTTFSLVENDTSHGITSLDGSNFIESGEYVILVDDAKLFANSPTELTRLGASTNVRLFKTIFSLTDSGKKLALQNKTLGKEFFSYTYGPATTDKTFTFDGTSFVVNTPTPGSGALAVGGNYFLPTAIVTNPSGGDSSSSNSSTTSASTSLLDVYIPPAYYYRSPWPESEKIYLYTGENRVTLSGLQTFFNTYAIRGDKSPVLNANFFWNFGDGYTGEGQVVSHTFKYPGEYVVNVEAYANGYKASDKIYVKVIEAVFVIEFAEKNSEFGVSILNKNNTEIDIGGLEILASGTSSTKKFIIPRNTIILPSKSIFFNFDLLGWGENFEKIKLSYPEGKVLSEYILPQNLLYKLTTKTVQTKSGTSSLPIKVFTREQYEEILTNKNNISTRVSEKKEYRASKTKYLNDETVKNNVDRIGPPSGGASAEISGLQEGTKKVIFKNEDKSILTSVFEYFGI